MSVAQDHHAEDGHNANKDSVAEVIHVPVGILV